MSNKYFTGHPDVVMQAVGSDLLTLQALSAVPSSYNEVDEGPAAAKPAILTNDNGGKS